MTTASVRTMSRCCPGQSKPLAWDVTVQDAHSGSRVTDTGDTAGAAADKATSNKEYLRAEYNNNIIIIIPGQYLWCCHHAVAALREFTLVHTMSAARRQVAADLWTKPIDLNHKPACRLPVNYTHHRHFIITQPES